MCDVAVCFDDVISAVTRALTAADDAASSLREDAAGVRRALEAVFSPRRRSGPGMVAYAAGVASRLSEATIAFVSADDEMAAQTSARMGVARGGGAVLW